MFQNHYVTEKEVATIGRFSLQTLRNWRHLGKGPAYLKVGRSIRYKIDDVRMFLDGKRIDPEGNGK